MVNDTWGLPAWLERGVADLFPAPRAQPGASPSEFSPSEFSPSEFNGPGPTQSGPGQASSGEALATRLAEAQQQGRPCV